ncbi:uncharacterized protein STEHIDRAFT_109176 [Stereum hirsutum FP-91666 SS1]|uniref:uncharacterized protein n=1 Tax=Stereum hirsutum (strain FP-91666) TaxID=721885 RepID=UPI000440A5E7|nr:uncharacterized protein STEHIDRAFT_109176 [Stereum hirsutum FP-91666 SS1]EIM88847.1 hypothetical protein STEHIDRAFT_109176 [Stereum hirsutum FP-91666 SS1]
MSDCLKPIVAPDSLVILLKKAAVPPTALLSFWGAHSSVHRTTWTEVYNVRGSSESVYFGHITGRTPIQCNYIKNNMDNPIAITLEREVFLSLEIQMSSIIVETVTYGLYVGIFMLSTYSIVSHWGLSVLYTILDVRIQSYRLIEANPTYPSSLLYTQIIQAYLSFIMYIMNDAVVLWRAWLLCGRTGRKAIYIVSALTLAVEIGLSVSSIVMLPPNRDSLLQQMTVNGSPEELGLVIILFFYVVPSMTFSRPTGSIVICLTLFLARTINSNVNHDPFSWVEVFYTDWKLVMNQITGIYPTLIVVLVCMKKTFHENVSASPVNVWTPSRIEDKVVIPGADPRPQHRPLAEANSPSIFVVEGDELYYQNCTTGIGVRELYTYLRTLFSSPSSGQNNLGYATFEGHTASNENLLQPVIVNTKQQ